MEGRDPAEARRNSAGVQAEIERAQQRLAWAVDEIVDRTSPRNVARRGWQRMRDTGVHLAGGARALVTGDGAIRLESHVVEPAEGSIRLKDDDEVVSTYASRSAVPTEAVLLGVGAGLVVTVGLVAMWRRRSRRR